MWAGTPRSPARWRIHFPTATLRPSRPRGHGPADRRRQRPQDAAGLDSRQIRRRPPGLDPETAACAELNSTGKQTWPLAAAENLDFALANDERYGVWGVKMDGRRSMRASVAKTSPTMRIMTAFWRFGWVSGG